MFDLLVRIVQVPFSFLCCLPSWILFLVPATYLAAVAYFKFTQGWCKCKTCMVGKTVLITGANTGLGKETARDMACRGGRVIIACRDVAKGKEAADEIIAETGNPNVVVRRVDLASFESVRQFTSEIKATEERLDVLINNAGLANRRKRELTDDGHELAMQTNHFSHVLLTYLLQDLLVKSAPSRVVVVSSLQHLIGEFDPDNILTGKNWNPHVNYPATKLANVMFANELARRLKGDGVTVNSCHPGTVRTQIYRLTPKSLLKYVLFSSVWPMFKNVEAGAQTIIHLAVSKDFETITGKYFADCKEAWMSAKAKNPELCKKCWDFSMKVVRLE